MTYTVYILRYFWCSVLIIASMVVASASVIQPDALRSINGQVVDEANLAISGVSVELSGRTTYRQMTDADGHFVFTNLPRGEYTLTISHIGYQPNGRTLTLAHEDITLTIEMLAQSTALEGITVTGKTETQLVREQAIRAVVVDTREVAEQPVTLAELMNRSPGVRIRQSGGLGSRPDISLNGFQGRSVRYFKDGIPLSYLGMGYGIHNIPVNTLERVEIYKGVLPVELGADALGGAVDLITRKKVGNHLHASYEIASFNTHRFSVNTHADMGKGWYSSVEAFYNYAKNNYDATVMVTDPDTRNQREEVVELFHNAYHGLYGAGSIGIKDKPWAKDLSFTLAYFDTHRQQQHPALMTDPYGAITGRQSSLIPSFNYHVDLLDDRLTIKQFVAMNTLNFNTIDTAKGYYDWYGNFTPVSGRLGEGARPSLSDVDIRQLTSRTYASWKLSDRHRLGINYVYTNSKRQGQDLYGPRFSGTNIDILSIPTYYNKQVLGLDWTGHITEQLTFSLMGKGYRYESRGTEAWANRPINVDEEVTTTKSYGGIAGSLKYQYKPNTFLRFSSEYAYRLPESDELFGDAIWVVPNFSLDPERSLNFNLGYSNREHKVHYELNTFYRETSGLILLVPTIAPYAQYRNINNVRGFGVEADVSAPLTRNLQATANFTWQSLRLFGFTSPQDLWRNGTRLQNTPFFFTNIGLLGNFTPFANGGNLSAYLNYNFVREFYLQTISKEAEPDGLLGLWGHSTVESAVVIPNQHLVSGGANYRFGKNQYTVGVEVKNILDNKLYDYFRVQRAGRSFHLKLTYQISTNKT